VADEMLTDARALEALRRDPEAICGKSSVPGTVKPASQLSHGRMVRVIGVTNVSPRIGFEDWHCRH
jgi:hypothetical protein